MNLTTTTRSAMRTRMVLGAIVAMAALAGAACVPPPKPTTTIPTLSVSPSAEGIESGTTVTVRGEGYSDVNLGTRPPLLGAKAGVYLVFGKFGDTWQPSEGAPGSARQVIIQKWVLPQSSIYTLVNTWGQDPDDFIVLNSDGTFEAELTLEEADLSNPNYGIVTYPGGGAERAEHEQFVPVSFASGPRLLVSPSPEDVEPGTTVTVTGRGYDAVNMSTRPPLGAGANSKESGVYVVFGKFADSWQPSAGAPGTARQSIVQMWSLPQSSIYHLVGPAWNQDPAQFAPLSPDGSFELQITLTEQDLSNPNYGIASYVAGGAVNRPEHEVFVPVSFAAPAE